MAVRQKQLVLDTAYKHFKEFELPLDIDYKSYMNIVGPKEAIHAISVKRSFKAWKYLLHALKLKHPDLGKKPEPAPAPKPAPKAKEAPKPSSKAAPAEEKSED
jgi:hypothetical protein